MSVSVQRFKMNFTGIRKIIINKNIKTVPTKETFTVCLYSSLSILVYKITHTHRQLGEKCCTSGPKCTWDTISGNIANLLWLTLYCAIYLYDVPQYTDLS